MPWTGSGSYILPPAFTPEANGTIIDATRYNGTTTDIANAITASLAKNGENTPTADLPMGGFKHTNAAAAVAPGQYLLFGQAGSQLTELTLTTGDLVVTAGDIFLTAGTVQLPNGVGLLWGAGDGSTRITGNSSADTLDFFTANTQRLGLDSVGRFYGKALHNNASLPSGTTNQYIASGTYTPTLANVSNATGLTASALQWIRVGNVVIVGGRVQVSASVTDRIVFTATLPIPSSLASVVQGGGSGFRIVGSGDGLVHAAIHAETVGDLMQFVTSSTGETGIVLSFTFVYVVA